MSDDPQDVAEAFDEELRGGEVPTSDYVEVDPIPDRPLGLPFADADVTDESISDRVAREEPEVWERPPAELDEDLEVEVRDQLDGLPIDPTVELDELADDEDIVG